MSENEDNNGKNYKLIESIDCTKEYGEEKYFGNDDVRVITNNDLKYRETGQIPSSRFGYRFSVNKVKHPHLVVLKYPHDKQRFMCVLDGTCYDLNTGLITGKVLPLTNKMEELKIVFWPRWKDCSITIMTYSNGEPAAAASIQVYEIPKLEPLQEQTDDEKILDEFRWIGMQFEDPCGATASVGAQDHFEWTDRVISYAKNTGQNLLIYPLLWYHGPLFPSKVEIPDITEIYVATDRKQYVQWSTCPKDWYQYLLEQFEREGLAFIGSLTLLRLSSLMKKMNTDIKSIRDGAETINNIVENNHVKESTGDWTKIHHASNYEKIVSKIGPEDIVPGFRMPKGSELAYGEKGYWANRGGPIFNPLHPEVQKSILRFIREIAERYKEYSAFKGISINLYASSFLWFGSIRLGYDDYTINLFEQENDIKIPGKPTSRRRFNKRYKYLLNNHKETWIAWRCYKVLELIRKIRDSIQRIRKDYRLIITLWDETFFFPLFGTIGKEHQFGIRESNYEYYREAGIDINLYKNESGISLDLCVGCTRDRGGHGPDATAGINIKPEHSSMYRDFDFLDNIKNKAVSELQSPGTFNFNCWIESWGKYKWFRPPKDDLNIKQALLMDGKQVDGMIGCNSFYPNDGFWWDSQLRIVPTFLAGYHYLEPFVHSLAEFDVHRMTSGGLFLDSAHSQYIKRFAKYFTALPAIKFDQIGDSNDPVAIRTQIFKGKRFIYAVNRECFDVKVKIYWNKDSFEEKMAVNLIDLGDSTPYKISQKDIYFQFEIKPYGLIAWSTTSSIIPQSFQIEIAPEIIQNLKNQAQNTLLRLENNFNLRKKVPGIQIVIDIIRQSLKYNHFAKLRRALTCYIVRKAEELYR